MISNWNDPKHVWSNCEKCWRINPNKAAYKQHSHPRDAFVVMEERGNLHTCEWWLCDDCMLKYTW